MNDVFPIYLSELSIPLGSDITEKQFISLIKAFLLSIPLGSDITIIDKIQKTNNNTFQFH